MTDPTSKGIIYRNPKKLYSVKYSQETIFFKTGLLFRKSHVILMTMNDFVYCIEITLSFTNRLVFWYPAYEEVILEHARKSAGI